MSEPCIQQSQLPNSEPAVSAIPLPIPLPTTPPTADNEKARLKEYRPRLKSGVLWFRTRTSDSNQIYIGLHKRGLLLDYSPELIRILEMMSEAGLGTQQVSHEDPLLLRLVLHELISHDLIESQQPDIERFASLSGLQRESFIARAEPEFALASWRRISTRQVADNRSRVDEVLERASFSILIFGTNRLAYSLLAALHATGFTQSLIIPRRTHHSPVNKRVELGELCGITLGLSDLGKSHAEVSKGIAQRAGLSHDGQSNPRPITHPSLIIATQSVSPDLIERWGNEGTAHIQIGDIDGNEITLGPLVIPGKSLCTRCIDISRAKKNPHLGQLALMRIFQKPPEIPVAALSLIAGLLTLEISTFASTGASNLLERTLTIDLHNPSEITSRYWTRESECGCFEFD